MSIATDNGNVSPGPFTVEGAEGLGMLPDPDAGVQDPRFGRGFESRHVLILGATLAAVKRRIEFLVDLSLGNWSFESHDGHVEPQRTQSWRQLYVLPKLATHDGYDDDDDDADDADDDAGHHDGHNEDEGLPRRRVSSIRAQAIRRIELITRQWPMQLVSSFFVILSTVPRVGAVEACDARVWNVCAFGRTGSGKSTTGNVLRSNSSQEGVFQASDSFSSVTDTVQAATWERFGVRYTYVDTPGLFDTTVSHADVIKDLSKVPMFAKAGCHVILLMLCPQSRFTNEERAAVDGILALLGGMQKVKSHLLLALSQGYDWPLERVWAAAKSSGQHKLESLLELRRDFTVSINIYNESTREESARAVHNAISRLVHANGGRPYTNAYLETASSRLEEILEGLDPAVAAEKKARQQEAMMQEQIRREQEKVEIVRAQLQESERRRKEQLVWRIWHWSGRPGEIIPIFNIARPDSLAVLRELGDGNVLQSVGKVCTVEDYATGSGRTKVRVDEIWRTGTDQYEAKLQVLR
ncbi:Gimap4 [Symbiodinium microadriaticum]|nr:Gimap4 [Symbiodinium microadriaticum]